MIAFGGWAALASALSLGPLTGAPVIGRPLELVAPIQFDESSTGNNAGCVTAQVLYGDNAVDAARVDVDLGAQIGRQTSYARISSVVPVDEPFVTVVLHAGCTRPFTKRYVLLAEAPRQDPMVLASAPALAVPVPVPVPVPVRSSLLSPVPQRKPGPKRRCQPRGRRAWYRVAIDRPLRGGPMQWRAKRPRAQAAGCSSPCGIRTAHSCRGCEPPAN